MDPELTSDQQLLRDTTSRFIESHYPLARVRGRADGGAEPGPEYRLQAAELGWFAVLAPERLGGGSVSGCGVLDAVVLAEERGRRLQPGSFIDTNVAIATLSADGTAAQQTDILPALIEGRASISWAVADTAGDWSGLTGVTAEADGTGYILSGAKGLVSEAQSASWLLVTTMAAEGPTQFVVAVDAPGVTVDVLTAFDLTRSLCEVRFDAVQVDRAAVVGVPGGAAPAIARQIELASVLSVAESVGALAYLVELTVDYCKDRTAFGRPIGSFQAVKHQLADSALLLEASMAASTGAARAVQTQSARAGEAASMAKAYVADAGAIIVDQCWQNFGGIAYTWEHDFHLYMRRLATDAAMYGTASWHRERVCQLEGI